jgi:uncharacterized protein (TIGR04255 family)
MADPRASLGHPLPAFERPPVTEVVVALTFDPIPKLTGAEVGRVFADYTVESEQPLYLPPTERFGPAVGWPQFAIQVVPAPPGARQWLSTDGETQLLQVQRDWVAQNWRRQAQDQVYPRFEAVRSAFRRNFDRLAAHLSSHQLGEMRVTQCEVTYVNAIAPAGVWTSYGDLSRVFTTVNGPTGPTFLPPPDDGTVQFRYSIRLPGEDEPMGRLHVSIQPAVRQPGPETIFVMTLTARGRPGSTSEPGPYEFFDIAHEWIVRGFVDLTTPRMHEVWGRNA